MKARFSAIAKGYDRANDLMTFGLVRLWRRQLVAKAVLSGSGQGAQVLDCASGTGDVALLFRMLYPNAQVTGLDLTEGMLRFAREKALKKNLDVKFCQGDLMALPFKDSTFDVVSISYGIRNVPDARVALAEMIRVLKPGGRLLVLETGEVSSPVMSLLFKFFMTKVVPFLGGLISARKEHYEYLGESSLAFPSGTRFCNMIRLSGAVSDIRFEKKMFGASYLYTATKNGV